MNKGILLMTASSILASAQLMAGASISESEFGRLPDGRVARVFALKNANGMEARISDYGGVVLSLTAPDKDGKYEDVVFGCDSLAGYVKESPYFGAIVGRCANRIAKGEFSLKGRSYKLPVNDPPNHLHGGVKGFDKVLWTATPKETKEGPSLILKYVSKDGEEGYPGELSAEAVYTLLKDDSLRLDISASCDRTTICNITNHSYFNLARKGDILKHVVTIPADMITPVDSNFIPTGAFMKVAGTPLDFNRPTAIGARIKSSDGQLKNGLGYDHNYVIRKKTGEMGLMGRVYDPESGRVLEVFSNQPGLQFYSGNFLDGKVSGKGRVYEYRSAFCMEPQHYPDSPNHQEFPSIVLKPGDIYRNTIIYKFSASKEPPR